MNTYGVDKGVTIRPSSTANLMVDSADRVSGTPWNFQIYRPQALINGYFSRVGTTEVVLEWCQPNISSVFNNTSMTIDISGTGVETYRQTFNFNLVQNFYTVGQILGEIQTRITTAVTGSTITCVAGITTYGSGIGTTNAILTIGTQKLAKQLDISGAVSAKQTGQIYFIPVVCPDLRPYRYLDITCENLTYAQDVKDASTTTQSKDVLCRWYFAFDEQPNLDVTDYPLLMGYERFVLRRIFNPPKQIKWDNNLPVGNLTFIVYDDSGNVVTSALNSNWLMTLQLSEN